VAYFQAEANWRGRKGKGKREEKRRWKEEFSPPKNFGVARPM